MNRVSATIAISGSLSGEVHLNGDALVGIEMPAAWTAAELTFQTSFDSVTYQDLYDEFGMEVTVQAAASRNIQMNPAEWTHVKYLKVRSGTSGTPVAQAAGRVIYLLAREV